MINWTENGEWTPVKYGNIQSDYGTIHIYAMTMTLGMIMAIIFCAWKFYRRGVSSTELAIAVIFLIPIGLMGASFFGKLNAEGAGQNADGATGIELLYFWKAGMAIHGGVYSATFVGLILFSIIGRKSRVSLFTYMDAILPNVLWGQVLGRWGNFFNHELTGTPIHVLGNVGMPTHIIENNTTLINWQNSWDSFSNILHLPNWILRNTMTVYEGPGTTIGGIPIHNGDLVQMSPIFLIESMALLAGWLLLVLIIPLIVRIMSKKPWKLHPDKYSFDLKYSWKKAFAPWIKEQENLTHKEAWDKAFVYNVDEIAKANYLIEKEKIWNSKANWFAKKYKNGRALDKANNPEGYLVIKAGFEGFGFFFVWNIVRFSLELQRPDDHLFIMYDKTLSLTIIGLTAFIGLIGMILSQNLIPWFTRKPGVGYEKDYFSLKDNPTGSIEIKEEKIRSKKPIDSATDAKRLAKEQKALEKLKKLENKKQ